MNSGLGRLQVMYHSSRVERVGATRRHVATPACSRASSPDGIRFEVSTEPRKGPDGANWGEFARLAGGVRRALADLPTFGVPLRHVFIGQRGGRRRGGPGMRTADVEEIPRIPAGDEFCRLGVPDRPLSGAQAACRPQSQTSFVQQRILTMLAIPNNEEMLARLETRRTAIAECIEKLRAADRELLLRRYRKGASTRQVAEELHRSVQGTRRSLQRIRETLAKCVRKKIAREDSE